MYIPLADQAKLFVQFYSKAMLDRNLQEVVSKSYETDLQGIAKIMDYGNRAGQMSVEDPHSRLWCAGDGYRSEFFELLAFRQPTATTIGTYVRIM